MPILFMYTFYLYFEMCQLELKCTCTTYSLSFWLFLCLSKKQCTVAHIKPNVVRNAAAPLELPRESAETSPRDHSSLRDFTKRSPHYQQRRNTVQCLKLCRRTWVEHECTSTIAAPAPATFTGVHRTPLSTGRSGV
jgi:hypothetical protein